MKRKIVYLAALAMSIASLVSCGEKESEPKVPKITQDLYRGLHVGETITINGENLEGLAWETSQYFVAEVDASQRIVAKHVGLAWLYTLDDNKFKVVAEVAPKFTDYDLPVLCQTSTYEGITYDTYALFGHTGVSHIKGYEKRTLDPKSKDNLINALLVYKTGNVKSPYVVYSFENAGLKTSGTLIDPAYISNLADFLKERYDVISIDVSKPAAYFLHRVHEKDNESIDYMGGLQYYSQLGGILLTFTEYSETKAISIEDTLDDLARQLEETLTH